MSDVKGKMFSVERRAQERGGSGEQASTGHLPRAAYSSNSFEAALLQEIASLRTEIADIREAVQGAGLNPAVAEPPDEAHETEPGADAGLRIEIAQMVRSIGRAKTHIAEIKHPMSDEDQMQEASLQLDTIVQTTENATNDIMSSVDAIEGTLKQIHGFTLDDPEVQQLIDQASNQLISIIEACSFQDLTGQRINQVVKTLRFIESRILAMIDIWGGLEAFRDLPIPEMEGEVNEEDDLLNGPALGSQGLSQEDIDALFD